MKRHISALLVILLSAITTASAQGSGLKLYVGSATQVEADKNIYHLQLVVCNNTTDTTYIPQNRLVNIQPTITNDLSLITDGGTFFILQNVPDLVPDFAQLRDIVPPPENYKPPTVTELDEKRIEENSRLPQKEVAGLNCYEFAPGKCLTIHSLVMTFPPEFLKLYKITEQQTEWMEVNLVIPIEYYTNSNPTDKDLLLISRTSEDLKNCILISADKK